MALTPKQLHAYATDGYLVVPGLIAPTVLAAVRARIDDLQEAVTSAPITDKERFHIEKSTATAVKPVLRKLNEPYRNDPLFRSLVETPAVLDIVAELTGGPQVMLYSDQVFLKPAFCGSEKPLHQDNSYFKITPHTAGITCWMAIDDATISNGCLQYIPGSHRLGLVKHRQMEDKAHLTPDIDFPLAPEIAVPVPAGSCIFHHVLVMHSSKANRSPNPRRAYAVHYANRGAEHSVRPWDEMIQLR